MLIKNIITINDFNYSQGGASKVAIDTANLLLDYGFNSVFVSAVSNDNISTLKDGVVQYKFNGNEFLEYENKLIGAIHSLKFKKFSIFVENILKKFNAEDTVIHIHGWTKACSSDFFRVIRKLNFKIFLTVHEYFTFCPNGAYFDYRTKKSCGLRGCSLSCFFKNCDSRNYFFKIFRFVRQLFYNKNINVKYIHLIFISEFERRIISNQIEIKKFSILENPTIFKETNSSNKKKYDYVYIGRTSVEKGVDLFLGLARHLKDKKFLIVGNCDINLKNVEITGWITENMVNKYLLESKTLIFPSLWPETFGLNVIKALSNGIPCIVSSNTAAEDFVLDGFNGYVFEQGNLNSLISKAKLISKIEGNIFNCKMNNKYIERLIYIYETS